MPKINEILLKLEGFQYDMSLYLNVVYYHSQLTENTSNLCTIIPPWENTVTRIHQWELVNKHKFTNRKQITCSKRLNLYVNIWKDFLYKKGD